MTAPVTRYTAADYEREAKDHADDCMCRPGNSCYDCRLAAMLRQAAAEGQGNERLQAQVAELEGWNDAALKREDELRVLCASLAERVKELEARVAKRVDLTTEVQA